MPLCFRSAHYHLCLSLRHRHFQQESLRVFPPYGMQSGTPGLGRILDVSVWFKFVSMCLSFGGNDYSWFDYFLFFSWIYFLRQYEHPSLVVRERRVSLLTLGVDVSFFLYYLSLFFFVACGGLVSDSEYKRCGA